MTQQAAEVDVQPRETRVACVWPGRGPCWWSVRVFVQSAEHEKCRACRHRDRLGNVYQAGALPCADYKELPEDLKEVIGADVLAGSGAGHPQIAQICTDGKEA